MKKIIAILLVLCMLATLGMAPAEEGVAPPMGDPVWCYDEQSYSAYVEGALSGDVTIPAQLDGTGVYGLYFSARCDQNAVTSLTMPETIYALQENSISYMTKLQSVALDDTLEVIGDGNFNNCPSLTSVTIPASVRLISESFQSCANLREIRFEGECPIFLGLDWAFYDLPEDFVIYVPDDQLDAYAEALADTYSAAAEHIQPSGRNTVAREQLNNEDWFVFDEATGAITGYYEYHAFVEIPASIGSRAFAQSSIAYMAFDLYAPIEIAADAFIDSNGIADLDLPWDSSLENRDAYAEMLREQCPNCTVWIN